MDNNSQSSYIDNLLNELFRESRIGSNTRINTNDNFLQYIREQNTNNRRNHPQTNDTRNNRNNQSFDHNIFREQLIYIILNYSTNIHHYQENIRLYNENVLNFIQLLYLNETNYRNNQRTNHTSPNNRFNRNTRTFRDTGDYLSDIYIYTNNRNRNFFNDVVVQPTLEQISIATRIYRYNNENTAINTRCPISLEDFQNGELVCEIKHCHHVFKREYIMDWFRRNVRCPVCRYDIREYNENNTNNTDIHHNQNTNGNEENQNNNSENIPSENNQENQSNIEITTTVGIPTISYEFFTNNNNRSIITNNLTRILQNFIEDQLVSMIDSSFNSI